MADAVFQGTVSGFRTIGGRKVVAITIEAPIEQQVAIAKIAENGAWVAVARLQNPPEQAEKPKRSWSELSVGEQAGIRCGEKAFWDFLGQKFSFAGGVPNLPETAERAAEILRLHFNVPTRRNIPSDKWRAFDADYQHWLRT